MKVLIVLCAVMAVSVAKPGYLAGGIAVPGLIGAVPAADVIPAGLAGLTAQGVPVDTPAVQAARAANAAAHINANGVILGANALGLAAHGLIGAVPAADVIPAGLAGLTAQGVPVDTPAVQAARAANAVAHINANGLILGANALGLAVPGLGLADVVPAGLVLTPQGVPVDTPSVQAARAANAAAHLQAKGLILG